MDLPCRPGCSQTLASSPERRSGGASPTERGLVAGPRPGSRSTEALVANGRRPAQGSIRELAGSELSRAIQQECPVRLYYLAHQGLQLEQESRVGAFGAAVLSKFLEGCGQSA